MAKLPPLKKRLMYKGATYTVVDLPSTLMYRGAFYDAVRPSRFVFAAEGGLPDVPDFTKLSDPGAELAPGEGEGGETSVKEDVEKYTGKRWDPNPEEKAPEDKEKPPWETEEFKDKQKLHDALAPFVAHLVDAAKETLSKFNIATSGNVQFYADEADGVDVGAPVATGAFSAVKDSKITFDYSIDLPTDYLANLRSKLKDKGLADVEKEGFAAKILSALPFLKSSKPKLQEVVFQFCKHGFAGSKQYVEELLSTVGFLQNVEARPGTLMQVPEQKATEEQQKEWAAEVFKQIIENEMHHHAGVDIFRKSEWGNKAKMEEVIKGLAAKKILGADQVAALDKILKPLTLKEYAELIRDILTPSQEATRFSLKAKVEEAVKELTKHEKYTGPIKFGIHKDGNIIAAIDAPYPFQYIFRQPAGGKVKFVEAGVEICDFTFIAKTEQDAKGLLTASLNLADAYKRAANPTVSQNRKERDAEELFLRIHDLSKKVQEQEGIKDQPPTPAEGVGVKPEAGKETPA